MKKSLAVFATVVIVACLISGFFAYEQGVGANGGSDSAYSLGYDEGKLDGVAVGDGRGFDRGFSEGSLAGYASGYVEGYGNGSAKPVPQQQPQTNTDDRYGEGYAAGLSIGKSQGYTEGYAEGNGDGFTTGFSVGYLNGSKDGAGSGYNIRDPTYNEMLSFVVSDLTDQNVYNYTSYNCFHFTRDVLDNAFAVGLKAGFVYVEFEDGAHGIVAFRTVDKGLVFVEPQSDDVVSLMVGQAYDFVEAPNMVWSFKSLTTKDSISL